MSFDTVFKRGGELAAGLKQGVLLGAAALVLTLPPAGVATVHPGSVAVSQAGAPTHTVADFSFHAASADARAVCRLGRGARDNARAGPS